MLDEQYLAENSLIPLILGNGHDDPYPVYDYLRSHRPLHLDKSGVWLASSHALVRRILENGDEAFYFGKNNWEHLDFLKNVLVKQSGPEHARQRKIFGQLFTPGALALLREFIDAQVRRMVAALRQKARFNLSEASVELAVLTVCKQMGIPLREAMPHFIASQGAASFIGSIFMNEDDRPRLEAETRRFAGMLEALVDAAVPGAEGAIPQWAALEKNGDFSRPEVVGNLMILFVTGTITTTMSIGNIVESALRHREIWESWCRDPALIPATARELLRHDTAGHAIARYAARDIEIDGQRIRRGDRIFLLLASANRDPQEFASPDDIDPDRPEGRHMTFGTGAHSCIGRMLSRIQIESLITELVKCLPDLTLDAAASVRTQIGRVHGHPSLWLLNRAAPAVTP
ncbi:MAG: cytochrome P450 [Burkholderiaceae bacterium]